MPLLTAAAALVVVLFRLVRVNETTVALAFLMLVLWTASRWRLIVFRLPLPALHPAL